MILSKQKSDTLGVLASTLCLIHCVATPFIFMIQTCSVACITGAPVWWKFIDYFFLIVSFVAIYRSTETTTKKWMKFSLWFSWFILLIVILNEKALWFTLDERVIYIPALSLIILHLYNRKYCQCKEHKCCVHS